MNLDSPRLEGPILTWVYWILIAISVVGFIVFRSAFPVVAGFFFVCLALLVYGGFIEPQFITVKRYRLPLVDNPVTWVRVVFLSDLHAGGGKTPAYYARVARQTLAQDPDLILFGGDFVEEEAAPVVDLSPFETLHAPLGCYFILGNHDYADDPEAVRRQFLAWGFTDATNKVFHLEKDGRPLTLIALEDSWYGHPDIDLLKQPRQSPRLLFIHQPDNLLDVKAGDVDVAVMGHTHGGQIRLPLIGKLRPLPSKAPQWLDRGLRHWNGIPAVISQGIGESDIRARLFCPPQIVILELGI